MKNDVLYYSVGALLYCPANKESIADSIIHEKFGNKFSLALCLEDTINDDFVTEAEQTLIESINKIYGFQFDFFAYLQVSICVQIFIPLLAKLFHYSIAPCLYSFFPNSQFLSLCIFTTGTFCRFILWLIYILNHFIL